ncbi:MAG: lysophospholipid acyltransferase family protein [Bacteroidota bacterium]
MKFYAPVKVHGSQNLPDRPFIVYSNHSSHLDFIILSLYGGKGFRNTCVIAAQDYWFENKWRKKFIEHFFNGIPVNRRGLFKANALEEMTAQCKQRISSKDRQRSLIVFPEGRRSTDGKIQKFKIGAAAIASNLQIQLVPALIKGSYESWPKGRWFMAPRKIELYFGDAFKLDEKIVRETEPLSAYKEMAEAMEAAFSALHQKYR